MGAEVLAVALVTGWSSASPERKVLCLYSPGSNAGICERLHLNIKTVEPAVSAVFTKLDLPPGRESNRRVLAVLAYVDDKHAIAERPSG